MRLAVKTAPMKSSLKIKIIYTSVFLFTLIANSVLARATVAQFKPNDPEYLRVLRSVAMKLKVLNSKIYTLNEMTPVTTIALSNELQKNCVTSVDNFNLNKSLEIDKSARETKIIFSCERKEQGSAVSEKLNYIISLDTLGEIQDVQTVQMAFSERSFLSSQHSKGSDLLIGIGAGVLVSGVAMKIVASDERDKLLHATVGSIIGGLVTYLARENMGMSETKSFWVGSLTAVLAGALKELYDSKHPANQTADIRDFIATSIGGFIGAGMIQISYKF
jgi:hypothetical protein